MTAKASDSLWLLGIQIQVLKLAQALYPWSHLHSPENLISVSAYAYKDKVHQKWRTRSWWAVWIHRIQWSATPLSVGMVRNPGESRHNRHGSQSDVLSIVLEAEATGWKEEAAAQGTLREEMSLDRSPWKTIPLLPQIGQAAHNPAGLVALDTPLQLLTTLRSPS